MTIEQKQNEALAKGWDKERGCGRETNREIHCHTHTHKQYKTQPLHAMHATSDKLFDIDDDSSADVIYIYNRNQVAYI